jgi:hypothetical protein
VPEAQAHEILIACARRKYQAGRDTDAILDGFVKKVFGIDVAWQFDPQNRAANWFRGPGSGRKVLCYQGARALRILPQYRSQRFQVAVVVTAGKEFGQRQLL